MADTDSPALHLDPPPRTGGPAPGAKAAADADEFRLFGEDGFTFLDFLDIINPLQHIPLVSAVYRDQTGDTIDPATRVLGGTLFGGPIGTAVSVANVMVEEASGRDMGGHMMAMFDRGDDGHVPDLIFGNGPEVVFVPIGGDTTDGTDVADYSEVLDWARGEIAVFTPHRSVPMGPPLEETPATAGAVAVAENIEVVRWAQRELAALHPPPAVPQPSPPAAPPSRQLDDGAIVLAAATAPHGGWFSEVMLAALERYHEAAGLPAQRPPTTRVVVD